jgi:hypothetical protein
LAAVSGIERDRQRIDGEVAPLLIVLDAARYHFRLAAVAAVALLARAHELHLDVAVHEHRRPEILENMHLSRAQLLRDRLSVCDAVAFGHDVDVLARPSEQEVAHVAPDGECLHTHARGHPFRSLEQRLVQHAGEAFRVNGMFALCGSR